MPLYLVNDGRATAHRREHVRMRRHVEWVCPSSWALRRQELGLKYQRTVLPRLNKLRDFIRFARSRNIFLVTYSTVTANTVLNLSSRSPRLLRRFRTLLVLCEANGVTIYIHNIRSVHNVWADRLSRLK